MYEITFKNDNGYTGEYGPLMFVEGKATTEDDWIASWFEGNGFNVEKKKKSKGAE